MGGLKFLNKRLVLSCQASRKVLCNASLLSNGLWKQVASFLFPHNPREPCHVLYFPCPRRNWFLTSVKLLRGLEDFFSSRGSLLEKMTGPWTRKGSVHRRGAVLSAAQMMPVRAQELDLLGVLASLVVQRLKPMPGIRETRVWSLGREDPLEKEMATHSSTLAWRIPWREEPGRLQSMGSQRVGHDWVTSLFWLET